MPAFLYRARDAEGKVVRGTIIAETEREALSGLDRQGLFPVEVRGPQEREARPKRRAGRVGRAELIEFVRGLADLLGAGMSVDRALGLLAENAPNAGLTEVAESLRRQVAQGRPLHEAMALQPKLFPRFSLSIVRAAETGGFLEDALSRIASLWERDEELKGRIRTALAYPALLTVVGTGAVIFLLTFFLPRFSKIFAEFGGDLPVITLALIGVSDFLRAWGLAVVAAIVGAVFLVRWWVLSPEGSWTAAGMVLRMPVVGTLVLRRALARFCRSLGSMLGSGVPILQAMTIARDTMGNPVLMRDVDDAALAVQRGEKLGQALGRSRWIPRVLAGMILVAEESGNLENVLVQASESMDRQVDRSLRVFVSLFEPLLLVLMAAIVGVIVIAILLPVFTLSTLVR